MIVVSWASSIFCIDVFSSIVSSSITFKTINSLITLKADMTNEVMTIEITLLGSWRRYFYIAMRLFMLDMDLLTLLSRVSKKTCSVHIPHETSHSWRIMAYRR